MNVEIVECEQGSPEWFAARLGIPTSSEFSTVMAKGEGKTRRTYLLKLAGEILTGEPMTNYVSPDMERGKLMEDEARDMYAFMHDIEPQRVGFVRSGDAGASPDSLIGDKGGLEIKSAAPHIQIERLIADKLPPEHKAQVFGSLWITGRVWWDFCSYCPRLPLFVIRVYRDETYIKLIADEVARFNAELQQTVETIRSYGTKAAA